MTANEFNNEMTRLKILTTSANEVISNRATSAIERGEFLKSIGRICDAINEMQDVIA